MASRQQIVDSIAAVARKLGRTPKLREFLSSTGITDYSVSEFFLSWNHAVKAAGLRPTEGHAQISNDELLADWGKVARKHGFIPTRHIYRREGSYGPSTLTERFGRWSSLPNAFLSFAKGLSEWADVSAIISDPRARRGRSQRAEIAASANRLDKEMRGRSADKLTYGNPIDLPALRHEPVNEQGVVLLFGMLAKDLGFIVETIRSGFPDCEAIRQVAPGRWQRVLIEFEFESKNFQSHGHPSTGCDVIVCWRHNWPDCPLEVVELSGVVRSLSG